MEKEKKDERYLSFEGFAKRFEPDAKRILSSFFDSFDEKELITTAKMLVNKAYKLSLKGNNHINENGTMNEYTVQSMLDTVTLLGFISLIRSTHPLYHPKGDN